MISKHRTGDVSSGGIFSRSGRSAADVESLPFIVTKNSKEALREQALASLMLNLKRAEQNAEEEGWIDAEDVKRELGVID